MRHLVGPRQLDLCQALVAYASLTLQTKQELRLATVVDIQSGRKPSIDPLVALVAQDIDHVNRRILEFMDSPVALIPQLAGHIIAAGGKRLRPMLTLSAAQLCGYQASATSISPPVSSSFTPPPCCTRRRRCAICAAHGTAHVVWGNKASVLVGDFLFSRAFQLMVGDGSLEVLRILSTASAVIAEGEVHQLLTSNDTETGEAAYLEVIKGKTAQLFSAAAEVGAVIADRPKVEREALNAFGMNLGLAFQLIDDALDYSAEQAKLGKEVGDDFREGKITLPVILAFRRGDEKERAFWRRTVERLEQSDDDLATAQRLIRKHGALDDTVARAHHYTAVGRDALDIFDDGPVKAALIEVLEFCVERAH